MPLPTNHRFLRPSFLSLFFLLTSNFAKAEAQIVPDNTLPNNSQVEIQQHNLNVIEGGTRAGDNLFHSFQDFSLTTGNEAFFNNAADVINIFNRVTGDNISNIDGLIRANGNANLFFLNPNGIIFGENASLDIGGSFVATTANSLDFADGTSFAIPTNNPNVSLTISIPIGLGFGTNPGDITVQGTGNNLIIPIPEFKIIQDNRPVGLEVQSGQTLALLGGNLTLEGGNLTAKEGRIELGSVGAGEKVGLTSINSGWQFNYEGVNQFQIVNLLQSSSLDTSGNSSGELQVRGQQVNINDGSAILANTLGDGTGGTLTIKTSALQMAGVTSEGFVSVIASDVVDGQGGNLNIDTEQLSLTDGAQIRAITFGKGMTGDININAQEIKVTALSPLNSDLLTTLETSVGIGSNGEGGDLIINTRNLRVGDGARIQTDTFDSGNAGNLNITAETIELSGSNPFNTGLTSGLSSAGRTGNGGALTINTKNLRISEGAQIGAITLGVGDAGSININASDIQIVGLNPFNPNRASNIVASTTNRGDGGNITINTNSLRVAEGARITSATLGSGNAGNIELTANTLELTDSNPFSPGLLSGISTSVNPGSTGIGGNININTESLRIADGAQIRANTLGTGDAGSININAKELQIVGLNPFAPNRASNIVASTINRGHAGNITINAHSLQIAEGGRIQAVTLSSGNAGEINLLTEQLSLSNDASISTSSNNLGDAGSINITAFNLENNRGQITATSFQTGGGQINLNAERLILDNQGEISTSVFDGLGNGGNITINTDTLTAPNSSKITANALGGNGGNILINAVGLFQSPDSIFTASSEFGIDGTVTINTPDNNIQKDLEPSQVSFSSLQEVLKGSCLDRNRPRGRFVIGGGGAFGLSPDNYYSEVPLVLNFPQSPPASEEVPIPTEDKNNREVRRWHQGNPIVPAEKIVHTSDGRVFLVAAPNQVESLFCQPN